MDLRQIGETLRQERERQGLGIAQVMELTKISRLNLEAIEAGQEKLLPHPVYARSFIKSYAAALGLDAEELTRGLRFSPREDYVPEAHARPIYASPAQGEPVSRRRTLRAAAMAVVLLAAAGVAGYYALPGLRPAEAPPAPAPRTDQRVAQDLPAAPQQSVPPASPEPASPAAPQEPAGSAATPLGAPEAPSARQPAQQPGQQAGQTPAQPPAQTLGQPLDQPLGQTPGQHLATIRAVEACWMQARFEDGKTREFYLRPGDSIDLDFKGALTLRLGNAGGVRITLNGQDFPFEAKTGQVMSVKLP